MAARLQRDCEYTTRLLQGLHNLVTTLSFLYGQAIVWDLVIYIEWSEWISHNWNQCLDHRACESIAMSGSFRLPKRLLQELYFSDSCLLGSDVSFRFRTGLMTPYLPDIGGWGEIKMASASTPSANEPAKDLILVHIVQLKPKAQISGRMVSSGIQVM